MYHRLLRTLLILVFTISVSIFFIASPVGAASRSVASGQQARAITSGVLKQDAASVRAYWTPARMEAAISADKLLAPTKLSTTPSRQEASGVIAPAIPRGQYTAAPLSTSKVPHSSYSVFPYSTVGKVFFTDSRTGLNYVCSGASANSNNLSVVDTAGHCVVQGGSGGNWYTNWQFCPQYFKGSTPYGCWVARQLWSLNTWVNTGSLEDDFGDAVVSPNGYGNIVSVVGGTGSAYGFPKKQNFTALGYPAEAPYNGNLMYKCVSGSAAHGFDDGTVLSIACNMTGGSSGGPWLISYNGTFGYVNGHNDFKYTNDPAHMYSPYYDSEWYTVFNAAQNS